tara:strand:+ start:209 stop:391 length:183 start_codon:yes stop_codon:yes gene_type:complete
MIQEIAERFCPLTIALNIGAIGISMTDVEMIIKLASYSVAIIWTTLRILKEIKDWNIKKK